MTLADPAVLDEGLVFFEQCELLGPVVPLHERPKFELVENPFRALARIVTFQQLSGKAAETIFRRFAELVGKDEDMAPEDVLRFDADMLRSVGLSRQKGTYILNIAARFQELGLEPDGLHSLSEADIREALLPIKGIGEWTVEMFSMFYLCRPDVFSTGDLGLQKAIQPMMKVEKVKPKEMLEFAERWRPWRTLASYYLWRSLEDPMVNRGPRSSD
ncbi:MAG: DNA-3-methyladenine glycosylase 2 family protein [Armatimonadetes bacterium]|nr:DNA-3-methyladenine glycosylase 2 family protein [Armatimonadota bacterium]MBS1711382.1 DNA-3-methyladenine glycosylase 2 family protein [Armatimonadota bacterium]MBX3107693.1 DNA-3-methyladenine glycosylase 2 family protein [Fimbriimonadaceae bacterium]